MATRTTSADRTKQTRSGRTKSSLKKRIKTLVALSILFILTALSVGAVYVLLIFVQESRKLPSVAEIGSFKPSEGSQLFFSDGSVMAFFATENRKPIKLTDMGRNLIDATVATEDSRFYEHPGVDIRGVSRAIVKNVVGG
ncbi:MAG: transglycosylase domain-containing protein, partial [Chthonomonadales bacterium]